MSRFTPETYQLRGLRQQARARSDERARAEERARARAEERTRAQENEGPSSSDVEDAYFSSVVGHSDSATIRSHVLSIANKPAKDVDRRDLIRSMYLNEILLHRHIDRIHRRNVKMYWLVAGLAAVIVLSSVIQITIALTQSPPQVIVRPQPASLKTTGVNPNAADEEAAPPAPPPRTTTTKPVQ